MEKIKKIVLPESDLSSLKIRLDALILIFLKSNFSDEKGNLKLKECANILYNVGFKPTEIALILGKKKATDVTYLLFKKNK